MTRARSVSDSSVTNFRNVLINGGFSIDQRNAGASQTITAGAAIAYTVDRWYAYCTGANIAGARVAGAAPSRYYYSFTGATSNTAVGFGQRIETDNSFHLAGREVTLSINIASTSLTSITWTAFRANTSDTFGTLASPTRTQIATGTFAVTSTLSAKTATFTVPAAATTGIEVVFTGGALLGSQTLTFDDAQLELGSNATTFEQRPIGTELSLCKRYFQRYTGGVGCGLTGVANSGTTLIMNFSLNTDMRVAPTVVSGSGQIWISDQYVTDQSTASVSVASPQGVNTQGGRLTLGNFSGLTTGRYYSTPASSIGSGLIDFGAEL
jgi:hypothetical protein